MNTFKKRFAICTDNTDYAASLIVKKSTVQKAPN